MNMERLLVTCGGTGGHFYPGLSVARTFQAAGKKVLIILSGVNSAAQAAIAESFGIKAVVLPPMPSPRQAPFNFLRGYFSGIKAAKQVIKEFAPQALLGMGSFAMLPVAKAAKACKVPLFLHDGNAFVGKANRYFSRNALAMGVAFPAANSSSCRCPVFHVGMPLRPELLQFAAMSKQEAIAALNQLFDLKLDPEVPTLLVTGGSQGAAIFNETVPEALKKLSGKIQVLHLAGKGKLTDTAAHYRGMDIPLLLLEKHESMELFMAAADVVISRSGGSTVAELALFGKAAILVPYPYAANDHQRFNAAYLTGSGAGEMVDNSEFTVEKAASMLQDFLDNPEKWQKYSRNAAKMAHPEAAQAMLDLIAGRI